MNSSMQKVQGVFVRFGFPPGSRLRRSEFETFLNGLVTGDGFSPEVAAEIWEQVAEGRTQVAVEELVRTISEAQRIVQNKILALNEQIKSIEEQLSSREFSPQKHREQQLGQLLQDKHEEKQSFEEDLSYLTEPFGISMIGFMANAARSRKAGSQFLPADDFGKEKSQQVQLKWLFYLCVCFGLIEAIMIFQKYDFLNLMVLAWLMLIFFMNQLDPVYMRFTLAALIFSQVLDVIWLFMNSNHYWNLPQNGTIMIAMGAYTKVIVLLTFFGVFLKIPLGVFLYHYRNINSEKVHSLNLGCFKMQLSANRSSPISEHLRDYCEPK